MDFHEALNFSDYLSPKCCHRFRRLKRCFPRQTTLTVIAIWTILILWFEIQLPDGEDAPQMHDISHTDKIKQSDLDYFAQRIQLNFSVQENSFAGERLFKSKVVLTNTGSRMFPWRNWSLIFCQLHLVEPQRYPYPEGLLMPESGIRLFHTNGGVFRIEPVAGMVDGICPGEKRTIEYISQWFNVAITDNYPNWYFAVEGLEPRIIESTRGESFDWIGNYNSPKLWKRISNPDDRSFDYYDPLTPEERFDIHVQDLKTAPLPVIPIPAAIKQFDASSKVNVLTGNWVIYTSTQLANEAKYLSDIWGLRVVLQTPSRQFISFIEEEVKVSVHDNELPTDESYELSVSPNDEIITIKASRPAGAFYGLQTLMSITDAQGNISKSVIQDAPRYKYRGIMLDVARNFQSKEMVFRYIDLMSMYKLNKLHFHLTDDEGWRLAIPGLSELTEIGATRCHDPSGTKCLLPHLGSGPFAGLPGSGYYSVEDYRAILRYAALHHIEVIPEVDMPGHSHAAIKAMEVRRKTRIQHGLNITENSRFSLRDTQDNAKYTSAQGFGDNVINPCLESTYTFITRIINSLYAMHRDVNPLKVFHFGGDEVPVGTWEKSQMCQHLKDTGVNMSFADYFAIKISNITSLYNLDLAGWEDGFFSTQEFSPLKRKMLKNENVYSYVWNNVWENGQARRAYDFANNGYKVVLTPATNLYFDHPQEADPKEKGLHWASRYSDTFKVYSIFPDNLYWNAITHLNGADIKICKNNDCPKLVKKDNIAGIQGTLFGELLRTQSTTDYMLLPRLIALADRAWHQTSWEYELDEKKREEDLRSDWTLFANTLGHKELRRLDKMGYKYRIPPPGAKIDGINLNISSKFPGLPVEVSYDNGKTWTEVEHDTPIIQTGKPCILRSRAASGFRYSRPVTVVRSNGGKSANPRGNLFILTLVILIKLAFNFEFA